MAAVSACVLAAMMHFEGLRLKAYPDAGSYAIGYGHRVVHARGQMTNRQQAIGWLRQDIAKADRCVRDVTEGRRLKSGERAALVDFCFNAGCRNLAQSDLLRHFNAGDHAAAAREFGRWVNSRGRPVAGLIRRRALERRWFEGKGCRDAG